MRKNPLLSRLKAALIDLEAAIPEEAVETKWMPRREAWVDLVKQAHCPLQLLAALLEMERAVKISWVSNYFVPAPPQVIPGIEIPFSPLI